MGALEERPTISCSVSSSSWTLMGQMYFFCSFVVNPEWWAFLLVKHLLFVVQCIAWLGQPKGRASCVFFAPATDDGDVHIE